MELKAFQYKVMDDISSYLECVTKSHNLILGWRDYWLQKGYDVALGQRPQYRNNIPGTPHVCIKSGTGSGKTFMAVSAVKRIVDYLPEDALKVVVWLVPSDSILTQTQNNLKDPDHPYRQRLNRDFGGRVEVYTKDELLSGKNFSPDTVREQLTVAVMSYASLRIDSKKKDVRKAFQENGNLMDFPPYFDDKSTDLPDTSLMSVLQNCHPIVIVDESHNATSNLSIEMLNNLDPCFVLDLTATPRKDSNIITYVNPREVKKANMVKLPVVVYKRAGKQTVLEDAIQLRARLEMIAKKDEGANGGDYIRPIVLFQAQPRKGEDAVTFQHIKDSLVRMGLPSNEIAIKTSEINELKGHDLLSPDCPIRYIITVNALKEGWDCPFAYILASLANKNSEVDVEQILGRILRQPYTHKQPNNLLNVSYVLTCSDDFDKTLRNVVKGLNSAGFSSDDYRVGRFADEIVTTSFPADTTSQTPINEQTSLFDLSGVEEETSLDEIDVEQVRRVVDQTKTTGDVSKTVEDMIEDATASAEQFEKESEDDYGGMFDTSDDSGLAEDNRKHRMKKQFVDEVSKIALPQFVMQGASDLFGYDYSPIERRELSNGFVVNNLDSKIDFTLNTGEMYKVDINEDDSTPKFSRMNSYEAKGLRDVMSKLPAEGFKANIVHQVATIINKRSAQYENRDLRAYLSRVFEGMSKDDLIAVGTDANVIANKIEKKIIAGESDYRREQLTKKLMTGEITVQEYWKFPAYTTPYSSDSSAEKSLYTAEDANLTNLEGRMVRLLSGAGNISWWHRNLENKEYKINGYINHYPDFIVQMTSGTIVLIETKGDHLFNDDSKEKIYLGRLWETYANRLAGRSYRYFMVFDNKSQLENGAMTFDEFSQVFDKL